MSRGVYMDVHVPAAITDGLLRRGIDVITAQGDDAGEWTDEELLERATTFAHIRFTQDQDLLVIGASWQRLGHEFAGIVYAHQLGPGIGEIIEAINALEHNPLIGRPAENDLRELVIGRRSRGYVALYRYLAELDIVLVLALRSQREAGYAERGSR